MGGEGESVEKGRIGDGNVRHHVSKATTTHLMGDGEESRNRLLSVLRGTP